METAAGGKPEKLMPFDGEDSFRRWLCEELHKGLAPSCRVLKGKNIADIIVSYEDAEDPRLIFLEVKYHKAFHGRIGIGNQAGTGYQIEYLINRIAYLEKYLLWVVGDELSDSSLILTNDEVRTLAAKGIRVGKTNNFKHKIFHKHEEQCVPNADLPKRLTFLIKELLHISHDDTDLPGTDAAAAACAGQRGE
ncbi:MAG: hypothetical protein ACO1TE_11570 [Prosthecobacter sp.]